MVNSIQMDQTDEQLISEYFSGDEKSLEILIKRYLKPIYNFIFHLTNDPQATDDISQETFFKVWKSLKKYRMGESFKAWVYRIAHNSAIDYLRKRKNVPLSVFEDEEGENFFENNITDTKELPDEYAIRVEDKKILDEAIKEISPKYREILILHYHEGLTFDEIGKIVNSPLNTVKSSHRRAVFSLRKILEISSKSNKN